MSDVVGQAKITGCDNLFTVSYIETSFGNVWSIFLLDNTLSKL